MSDRAWKDKIKKTTPEEIKELCMELYLLHGKREFEADEYFDSDDILGYHLCIEYVNPMWMHCSLMKLTPKALELIKGTINET